MATAPQTRLFIPLIFAIFFFLLSLSISLSHAHRLSELPENAASFQIEKLLDETATTTGIRKKQSRVNELLKELDNEPKILLPTEIPESKSETSSSTTTDTANPNDINIEAVTEKKQPESDATSDEIEETEKKLPESGTIPSKNDEKETTLETGTEKLPTVETTQPLTMVNLIPINPNYPRDYQMRRSSKLPFFRFPRRCRHRHPHNGINHQQLVKQWESRFGGLKQQQQLEDVLPTSKVQFGDDLVVYKNGGFIGRKEIPARWIGAGEIGGAEIFHQVETKVPENEDGLPFDEFKRPNHFYHHHRHQYEHHHHHHHELDDFEVKKHEHKHEHDHEMEKKHHEEKDDGMLVKIRKFLTRI